MWPFTDWKTKYLTLETRLRVEVIPNAEALQLGIASLKKDRDHIKDLLDKRTLELIELTKIAEARRGDYLDLFEENNTTHQQLTRSKQELAAKEAQILELTGFAEVLKSEIQAQKDLYATDTHNLLVQKDKLETDVEYWKADFELETNKLKGTISFLEGELNNLQALYNAAVNSEGAIFDPTPEPKPQLVQVTEDFFGKLAAELANQWTKTSTQSNGDAHGKVSDRLTSMQQFASTSNKSISNTASTKVSESQMLTKIHQPVTEYIPSPDFAASFDEGATQVDGQSVATGLSITQPATGPIKLPSQMAAEYEAPYYPEQ